MVADHHAGEPLNPEYVRVWAYHFWNGSEWDLTDFDEALNKHYHRVALAELPVTGEWLEAVSADYGVDF